jgi:hypothetical protein
MNRTLFTLLVIGILPPACAPAQARPAVEVPLQWNPRPILTMRNQRNSRRPLVNLIGEVTVPSARKQSCTLPKTQL